MSGSGIGKRAGENPVAIDDNKRVIKQKSHGFSLVGGKVAPFVIDQLFVSGIGGLNPPLSDILWLDSSGVERLPEEQRVGGAKPSPATNFNGCMKPNRQGVCGKRTGEIPDAGSNPTASAS